MLLFFLKGEISMIDKYDPSCLRIIIKKETNWDDIIHKKLYGFNEIIVKKTENYFIPIKSKFLDFWGISEEQLWKDAEEINSQIIIKSIKNALEAILGEKSDTKGQECDDDFFVVSNKDALFGASALLLSNNLEAVSKFEGGSFYAIPSSIHEWLILPVTRYQDISKGFGAMIRDINSSCVAEKERLDNQPYLYDAEMKRFGRLYQSTKGLLSQ